MANNMGTRGAAIFSRYSMEELDVLMEALTQYVENNDPDECFDVGTKEHTKLAAKFELVRAQLDAAIAEHLRRLGM